MDISPRIVQENCQRARALFARSRREHFAIGAFNIDNQETLIAVCTAAKSLSSPVLVEVSQGEVDALGLQNIRSMVDTYAKEYGVELYLNLDHSPSVAAAKAGIDAGFECIHIDISQANHSATLPEIIAATKEVVEYAKKTGALVESEPHYFSGSSNLHTEKIDYESIRKTFTSPVDAQEFVKNTGIDTFAVAIGNLHGKYAVPKILDIALLSAIRAHVSCFLSLHGGSGTPQEYFSRAVAAGISKININSDLRVVYRLSLEKVLQENPNEYAIVKLMPQVIQAVSTVVQEKIRMFGSEQKAIIA